MNVNGYEIVDEPTQEEFAVYFRVQQFFEQEWIAQWLGAPEDDYFEERLTQDEFERLCWRFHDGDFSAEESEYLYFLQEQIIKERSE